MCRAQSAEAGYRRHVEKLRRLMSLAPRERRCKLEAMLELTRASVQLKLRRRTTAHLLGTLTHEEGAGKPPTSAQSDEANLVGRAIAGGAHRLPWHPTCLRQAIAAQRMLRRR